jgi:hypothetical protein
MRKDSKKKKEIFKEMKIIPKPYKTEATSLLLLNMA